MSVTTPGAYGIIVRRNERTFRFIRDEVDRITRANPTRSMTEIAGWLNQDADLFAASVAMSWMDLEAQAASLEEEGAVRGVDFVVTNSRHGIIGTLPDWLVMELTETGNPPELEAKMTPEVYQMWQQARSKTYRLRTEADGPVVSVGDVRRATDTDG